MVHDDYMCRVSFVLPRFRHPRIPVIDWVFSTRTAEEEEMSLKFMDVCSVLFVSFLYICLCVYLQIQFWAVVYLW